jgi:DNA helicase IV
MCAAQKMCRVCGGELIHLKCRGCDHEAVYCPKCHELAKVMDHLRLHAAHCPGLREPVVAFHVAA